MKLRLLSTFAALLSVAAVAACATSAQTTIADPAAGNGTNPDGTGTPAAESDDPADQPPHSLGTIVLGEAHGSGGAGGSTKSTPIVSAVFLPDAMLSRACKTKLDDSCEIQKVAKCSKVSTTTTGCNSNEACVPDNTTCKPVCKAFAVCQTACAADEVCKPSTTSGSSGSSGGGGTTAGTCEKVDTFDAGPLAFSGTTTPITMFPPYEFESTGQGAPFLGGAELHVQASGATESGFQKFDETFTATTFLQTTPSLAKLTREQVFGTAALPIAWAPANDTILITISGAGGSATCKVKDSLGKFDVPRAVLKAAQGDGTSTTTSSSSLSISVSRQKKDVKKDKHAIGGNPLTSPVKPNGWLELVTLSSESASFQGCSGTQAICGDACTDLSYDTANCGKCGNACTGSSTCSAGKCTSGTSGGSCTTCRSNAQAGSCSSYYNSCTSNIDCDNLAYCAKSCTSSSCVANCEATYPAGKSYYASLKSCLSSYCSSTCGF